MGPGRYRAFPRCTCRTPARHRRPRGRTAVPGSGPGQRGAPRTGHPPGSGGCWPRLCLRGGGAIAPGLDGLLKVAVHALEHPIGLRVRPGPGEGGDVACDVAPADVLLKGDEVAEDGPGPGQDLLRQVVGGGDQLPEAADVGVIHVGEAKQRRFPVRLDARLPAVLGQKCWGSWTGLLSQTDPVTALRAAPGSEFGCPGRPGRPRRPCRPPLGRSCRRGPRPCPPGRRTYTPH